MGIVAYARIRVGIGEVRREVDKCAIYRKTKAAAYCPQVVQTIGFGGVKVIDEAVGVYAGRLVAEPACVSLETVNQTSRL